MPWLIGFGSLLIAWSVACAGAAPDTAQADPDRRAERARMVDRQLRGRDITSARVLDAMRRVPRHLFVPESERGDAYGDHPLPIGHGQTISQPYIVAFMTESLDVGAGDRVL